MEEPTLENLIKALQIFLKYKNVRYPTFCADEVRLGFVANGDEFVSFVYGG